MSGRRRILTVFGTRPEAIKLFPLIHALDADSRFDSRTCVTGQHRAMLDQVLEFAGIVPHHDLDLMQTDQSLDRMTAALVSNLGPLMDDETPDWIVVQGDTTTAMAGALCPITERSPSAMSKQACAAVISISLGPKRSIARSSARSPRSTARRPKPPRPP